MIRITLSTLLPVCFLHLCFCTNDPTTPDPENTDKSVTLFISTFPVCSDIQVDNKIRGRSPLDLKLTRGEHTVAFSPVRGFQAPPETTFILDDSIELTGHYGDLLIDTLFNIVPPQGSLWVIGTTEKPQKNGNIYEYIDGAAEIFIRHGYDMTLKQEFKDTSDRIIKLEIYYMQDEKGAAGVIEDSAIRTGIDSLVSIGAKGYAYHPVPDYMLDFYRSCFYVKFYTRDDSAAGTVNSLAECLDIKIQSLKP